MQYKKITVSTDLPLVSVFMPVYNQELYIAAAIDSVLQQSYENYEIVISDDCSSDQTPVIVEQYAKKFPEKIKLQKLANKNLGQAHFEALLKRCRGEYVCMFSGDDIMYPDKIERQIIKVLELGLSFHGHAVDCIDKNGIIFSEICPQKNFYIKSNYKLIITGIPVAGCSWLVKKSCVEFAQSLSFLHDFDMVIKCLRFGRSGFISNEKLGQYRITQESWSRNLSWRNYLYAYFNLLISWIKYQMYLEIFFLLLRVIMRLQKRLINILRIDVP